MHTELARMDVLIARSRELERTLSKRSSEDDILDAVAELERAATASPFADSRARFEADQGAGGWAPNPEDALAEIAFELHSGALLITAGRAIPDETEERRADPKQIGSAVKTLERVRAEMAAELGEEARVRFEADADAALSAIDHANPWPEFGTRAKGALELLTTEASDLVGKAFDRLKEVDPAHVSAALAQFGQSTNALAAVGRLVRLGVKKVQEAYNALIRLLGVPALQGVKEKVEQFVADLKSGALIRDCLSRFLAVPQTMQKVTAIIDARSSVADAVAAACEEIVPLGPAFKKHIGLLSTILTGLTVAAAVLAFTGVGANATIFIAAAYLLVIGAVVVIGREYSGAEWTLHWVRGVGRIADDLAAGGVRG